MNNKPLPNSLYTLPNDVLRLICNRLDLKSLLRFSRTCKHYNKLISNYFTNQELALKINCKNLNVLNIVHLKDNNKNSYNNIINCIQILKLKDISNLHLLKTLSAICPNLKELYIDNTAFEFFQRILLSTKYPNSLQKLSSLILCDIPLSSEILTFILLHIKTLTEIKIAYDTHRKKMSWPKIDDLVDINKFFIEFSKNNLKLNLKVINISPFDLSSEGINAIAKSCPKLETLYFFHACFLDKKYIKLIVTQLSNACPNFRRLFIETQTQESILFDVYPLKKIFPKIRIFYNNKNL